MRKPPVDTPCGYCFQQWATIYDHMRPRRLGGNSTLQNLHPSCLRCNTVLAGHCFNSIEERREYVRQVLIEKRKWTPGQSQEETDADDGARTGYFPNERIRHRKSEKRPETISGTDMSRKAKKDYDAAKTAGNALRSGFLGPFGRTSCLYCKKTIPRTTRQKLYCSSTCRFWDWKDRQGFKVLDSAVPIETTPIPSKFIEKRARAFARNLTSCRLTWHPDGLPGRPQFANKRHRIVVFLYECFLHGCSKHWRRIWWNKSMASKRIEISISRTEHQRAVDARWRRIYRVGGWRVITIWEHSIRRVK